MRGLYTRLTKDGVDAWLDKAKLLPGQDWELEIRKAVREADVVVVCLSKQFNQAGFRQKEVRLALDTAMEKPEGEIFIIPARLEECDNLESLRKWHWVDLFEDDGYEMLKRALRARADKIGGVRQKHKEIQVDPLLKKEEINKKKYIENSVIDSWVDYMYTEVIQKFKVNQIRSSVLILIKKLRQLMGISQRQDALDLINRIEKIKNNLSQHEITAEESFVISIECAIAAYKVSEFDMARKLLVESETFATNFLNKGILYWLLGCVYWLDISEVDNALLFWERGLDAFEKVSRSTNISSSEAQWFSVLVEVLSTAIGKVVENT
ncbi:MAG: toll/interleukin-1 receptor domain-containing protein [Chloroflexi bacterium]|nr:toll/interleukin-1 receptor domain-containing protein [Chloroflexota bacterium]